MDQQFNRRPTNGRTMKKKYEVVAPNIRRTVFNRLDFSSEFAYLSIGFATIQTQKSIEDTSDVITYPLIQETFAFVESNLESKIDRQDFRVGFRSKQI
jgi:hypothetical protein